MDIFEVEFPFHRPRRGPFPWKPGSRMMTCLAEFQSHLEADGMGRMLLNRISVHKPGTYPERTFYTRTWVDPDGNQFGKPDLKITASYRFKSLCSGYGRLFRLSTQDHYYGLPAMKIPWLCSECVCDVDVEDDDATV